MTADRTPTSEGPRCDVCGGVNPPRNPYWRDNLNKTCDPCEARITEAITDRLAAASPEERGGGADPDDVIAEVIAAWDDWTPGSSRSDEQAERLQTAIESLRAVTPAAPSEPAPLDVAAALHAEYHGGGSIDTCLRRDEDVLRARRILARLQSTPTPTEEPT